ncbi:MAG TPA: hypothetical protein PK322_02315 [Opitutaceae bacterium]|nr:hypothetical protein [Opitutaceae bacterium]
MKTLPVLSLALAACLLTPLRAAATDSTASADRAAALDLAARHLAAAEPRLDDDARRHLADLRRRLEAAVRLGPTETAKLVGGAVDQFTLDLAALKDFDALTGAAALLVQTAPGNWRAANLLGSVLHTADHDADAALLLEYARTLAPANALLKLNLGAVYADLGRWEELRGLAEAVLQRDAECRPAHKLLAWYWYEKKNLGRFHEEMFKAAQYKGLARKKTDRKNRRIAENEGHDTDSTETLARKTKALAEEVPLTTADLIEDELPAAAAKIREEYGQLAIPAQFGLPNLPGVDLTSPEGYRRNRPVIDEWVEIFDRRHKNLARRSAARLGINIDADRKTMRKQARAAARTEIATRMQEGQGVLALLENMENLPPAQRAKLQKAKQRLQEAAQQQGVALDPAGTPPPATIPGRDHGGPFAEQNFRDYERISATYERYLARLYAEHDERLGEISRVYDFQVKQENTMHAERLAALEASKRSNSLAAAQEVLRHIRSLNLLSQSAYQQWATITFPLYTQKLKPALEAHWRTTMLHVRNLQDPRILLREYDRTAGAFGGLLAAAGHLLEGGREFRFHAETEDLERELEAAIEDSREKVERERPTMEKAFREPEFDLSAWLEKHLVLELACQFLALKITAHSIEFEAWAYGPAASLKYDWAKQELETRTGLAAKARVGVNLFGAKLGVDAKGEFIGKTATWDFEKGTYSESYGAKSEVSIEAGGLTVSGEASINTQLEAKLAGKILLNDTVGLQTE